MKILIIAPQFYPKNAGYANAITNFVYLLIEMGEKIDVLTPESLDNNKEIERNGLKIYRIKNKKILRGIDSIVRQINIFRNILKLDKRNNYKIIFCETLSYPIVLYLISFTSVLKKTLIRIHGCSSTEGIVFRNTKYQKFLLRLLKRFFRKTDFISATTPHYIDFAQKFFLDNNPLTYGKKDFMTIPNFTYSNITELKNLPQVENILDSKTTFLALGGMRNKEELIQKGLLDIIYAVSSLKEKDYFKKIKLIIVGDGECRDRLIKITQNLDLSKNIIFIKKLPNNEVQYLQSKTGAVIMASRYEGLSMFGLESLCNGAPLIMSKVGGLKDLIRQGGNGLFFEPQNILQLSQKMDFFIKKADMALFKEKSKKLYEQKFAPEKIYKNFSNIVKIMTSSHKNR